MWYMFVQVCEFVHLEWDELGLMSRDMGRHARDLRETTREWGVVTKIRNGTKRAISRNASLIIV